MFTSNKKSLFQLQTQALHICKAKWGTQRTTGPVASVFHKYFMIAKRCRPKQWLLGCEDVQSSGALRGLGLTLKCSIKFEYCLLLLFILNTIVNSVLNLNLCIYHKCQILTEYIFQSPRKTFFDPLLPRTLSSSAVAVKSLNSQHFRCQFVICGLTKLLSNCQSPLPSPRMNQNEGLGVDRTMQSPGAFCISNIPLKTLSPSWLCEVWPDMGPNFMASHNCAFRRKIVGGQLGNSEHSSHVPQFLSS